MYVCMYVYTVSGCAYLETYMHAPCARAWMCAYMHACTGMNVQIHACTHTQTYKTYALHAYKI